MIKIQGLTNTWGSFSLKNINLEIQDGEYFMVLGPSGSGKTLFIETLAGLHFPEKGLITINGNNTTFLAPEKRNIGFVYQQYWLFNNMTVRDNILFGTKFKKGSRQEKEKKVDRLIDLFNLKHIAYREPLHLSGGEQQRVAFARAMAIDPTILFLDEPFGPLDYNMRDELKREIRMVREETGITIIHVTHDHTEAMEFANRIMVLDKGELIDCDTVENIFLKPKNMFLANFFGNSNIFDINNISDGIELVFYGKIIEDFTGTFGVGKYCIRPENIIVSELEQENSLFLKSMVLKSFTSVGSEVKCEFTTTKKTEQIQKNIEVHVPQREFKNLACTTGSMYNLLLPFADMHRLKED